MPAQAELEARGAQYAEEHQRMINYQTLAEMALESLLYYVLVGEGRKKSEPVEG